MVSFFFYSKVNLTLWGQVAEEFDGSNQPVVAVKGGRVNEFQGGKTVSLPGSATLQVNPDIPESHQLKGWFDDEGSTVDFKSISLRTGGGGAGLDGKIVSFWSLRFCSLRILLNSVLTSSTKPSENPITHCRSIINFERGS